MESKSDPVLALRGEIDASTTEQLDTALTALTSESGPRLIVDLSGVTFMDSTAVHSFMRTHQTAQADDRRLVFVGTFQPAVEKVFEVMGLTDILNVETG